MSDTKHTPETKLKTDNFRIRFDDEEEEFVAECSETVDAYVLVHRYNTHPALLEALESITHNSFYSVNTGYCHVDPHVIRAARDLLATARA